MRDTYPRYGKFVEFDGVKYLQPAIMYTGQVTLSWQGDEPPNDGRFEYVEKWKEWQAVVQLKDCTLAYEVTSKAKYLGHECQVMSINDQGMAEVYYLGGDQRYAELDGFEQVDKGTFAKLVPLAELYDFREEHRDLLFELWREENFVRADGPVS